MIEKIATATNKTTTHIRKHRAKYASAATAGAFLTLMARNAKVLNEFLEEHNLIDEYYHMNEDD